MPRQSSEPTAITTIRMPLTIREELDRASHEYNVTKSWLVIEVLRRWMVARQAARVQQEKRM